MTDYFPLHIAVDFGTDGIGVAYALGDEDKIFIHSKWNSSKYGTTIKPKTIILLDDEGGVTFGMDAKFTYMNLASSKKQTWLLFERFKMSLYDDKIKTGITDQKDKIEINEELTAANGKKYPSEKIFIAAFKHIEKECHDFIKKKKLFLMPKKSDIQWIITVPAIWSNKAKNKMKEWIIRAGLVDENIDNQYKIVYEPNCASLAIQYEVQRRKDMFNIIQNVDDMKKDDIKSNDDTDFFGEGEKYILIDAGGGTVDVACHEILGKFGVKEIYPPSGGPWGSCYIDDEYIKLLEKIFSKQWMDEFKQQSPNIYVEIMHNFQETKLSFFKDMKQEKHNCPLPYDFVRFLDEKVNDGDPDMYIEDMVDKAFILQQNNLVALSEELLEIDYIVWESMFDHVLDPTIKHIQTLLNEAYLRRNCKYLCLVGGLSCSPYFQYKMEKEFGSLSQYKLQLVIPKRPNLSVLEGAAYFGITKNYIKSQRLLPLSKTNHHTVVQFDETKKNKSTFKLHIAIDFGTDGIGLAYAIDDKVYVHQRWNSKKYGSVVKPKTIILFDNEGGVTFGMDAKFTYMTLSPTNKQKWFLFERFKMALYETEINDGLEVEEKKENDDNTQYKKIQIKHKLQAANGKTYSSEKVFVAAFQHLQNEANKFLRKKKLKPKKHEIEWIITVPAIWNDKAKNCMKQWAVKAGLVDEKISDQCKIVYEPDCASLAIQHEIQYPNHIVNFGISNITDDDKDDIANDKNTRFKKGEKYILIDAGGGTVDIACHEILGEFGVKEIYHPSGGPWGSCYIDDEFIKILQEIFSKQWMDEFKQESRNSYVEILHMFQAVKATFYQNNLAKKHNCRLPDEFLQFLDEKANQEDSDDVVDIESIVNSATVYGKSNLINLNDDVLEMDVRVWISMFDHVITPTLSHIKKLLDEPQLMLNCKYLCLVGGLSCSSYFKYRMNKEFGEKSKYKMEIITPQRPIISVVKGAAYFGITSNYVKARRLPKTYGMCGNVTERKARINGISEEYIKQNSYYDEIHECRVVLDVVIPFVHKNQEIFTDQVIERDLIYSTHEEASVISLVSSNLENPKSAIDCQPVADVMFGIGGTGKSVVKKIVFVAQFHFYDTLLKVMVYPKDKPNDIREVELQFTE